MGGMDVVLIPGANHGGWWYQPVVERLDALGHRGVAVTLDGLDPDDPEPARPINLDTHIAQLLDLVRALPEPVVAVGHSYAGSVLSGAADAAPDRFRSLVYVDACVPEDGDSTWSMVANWEREWFVDGAGRTGLYVDKLPFFDERAVAHPLATLLQRSQLTGAWRTVADKHYVAAVSPAQVKALIASELDPKTEVVVCMADRKTLEKAFKEAGLDNARFVEPK